MNADDFLDAIRDDRQVPLSRLGSSKSLYAETGGEIEPDPVIAAALADERAAAATFDEWADDTEGPLGDAVADAADIAREHATDLESRTDAEVPDQPAMYDTLADLSTTVECLGGVVGRSLVASKKTTQRSGFFTGQADPQTAQLFRGFREDVTAQRDQAVDLLASQCESDDDWDAAVAAATAVIQTAYDEYVETLEGMGINPKDVC